MPISCTNCKAIYRVKTGDQPDTGTVDISYDKSSLPGHYEFGTIRISYNFSDVVSQDGTLCGRFSSFPRGKNCSRSIADSLEPRFIYYSRNHY